MKYDVVVQPRAERDIQLAAHWIPRRWPKTNRASEITPFDEDDHLVPPARVRRNHGVICEAGHWGN